jgi:hypothetical protein
MRALVVAVWLAATSLAHAQPAGAQAEVLFRQGRDLMAAGKYAEACTAFEASEKLDPVVTTLLNLASCREKNGQLASAWGLYLEAERKTRGASDDKLHAVALDHASKLEARVSKLTINVTADSKLDRLEVLRDGQPVEAAMWNRSLPIDGGTYTITARAPGAQSWSTQITVAREGDVKTVDVPKLQGGTAVTQSTAMQPPEPPPPPAPHRSKAIPIGLGIGAVALLGGALAFSLSGDSTYNDAKAEMTDQTRRDSLYNQANQKRYIAEGLGVAGLACAGASIVLFLRGRNAEPDRSAHIIVAPNGFAIAGSF